MFRPATVTLARLLLPRRGALNAPTITSRGLTQGAVQSMVEVADGATIAVTRYNAGCGDGSQLPLLMINGWTCPGDLWGALFTNGLVNNK